MAQGRKLRNQKPSTGVDFRPYRFVLRRDTAHGVDDATVDQHHPVIGAGLVVPLHKPVFPQCGIEQVPGIIPGKGAPGEIRPAQAGSQADDHKARIHRPKSGHGGIELVGKLPPVLIAKIGQTRAQAAIMVWLLHIFPLR